MGIPTYLTPYLPALLSGGILVASITTWWAALLPRLTLVVLSTSLVFGQLIRIPLPGQGGGVLLSDIAVVLILIAALIKLIRDKKYRRKPIAAQYPLLITPFIIWSLFTLLIRIPELGITNTSISFSYWLRLSTHLLLIPALLILLRDAKTTHALKKAFLFTIVTLTILGLAQMATFPNIESIPSALIGTGWDPHQHRLVSSWLDPNFFGAFLAIAIPFVATQKTSTKKKLLILSLTVIALILTKSRSALTALVLSTLVISPFLVTKIRSQAGAARTLAATGIGIAIIAIAGMFLDSRLGGFWQYDPTVDLRISSLGAAWNTLAQQHSLLGIGYNTYQFAAQQQGLISNFSIHSRAGTDNSFLTIFITTGLLGTILFITPWAYLVVRFAKQSIQKTNPAALAGIFSILILFFHAQVVNSFLYSHLLITLSIIVVLTIKGESLKT